MNLNDDNALFDQLLETTKTQGPSHAAKFLVDQIRAQGNYPELFEALKIMHRIDLGLPAVQTDLQTAKSGSNDEPELLNPEIQDQLDKRLIEACREVGTALLRQGKLQEGWMYMRAVGDRKATAEAIKDLQVTHENLDTFLGLLVHEAVDVERGTRLSLEMRGTCNTITMLDSVVSMRGRREQQAAVGVLVEHVHQELLSSIQSDLIRREADNGKNTEIAKSIRNSKSIDSLISSRPNLLRDGTYHLDTTHLASTIRFARILDRSDQLRLAIDIAQYGRQLHSQYQYPSEEPFADLYPMSLAMFRALVGEHVDSALHMFRQKAESLDVEEHGPIAIETYVDLLTRVGRHAEAMSFLIKKMPRGMRPYGIAPSLIELAEASGEYDAMMNHAKSRGDLIGYAAALLQGKTVKPSN